MNFLSITGSFLRYNLKKYHISVQVQKAISMSRSLNIFSYQMNVDSPIGEVKLGYGMKGSHQFRLNDKILCDIDKKKLTIGGDEYHIEIDDTQDQHVFLLITIALDRIYYTKK
ncbi:hypothetical protein [Candidatus Enterococcus lemimoniae]|nr:hypothetical protein [Enterococcus sp. 12C11_DIV0727]